MKTKTRLLWFFAALVLIFFASHSTAYAQASGEPSATAPSAQTSGPLPSFPSPPRTPMPPSVSADSGLPSVGTPGSNILEAGPSNPASTSSGILGSSGLYSGSTAQGMPSNPYSVRESGTLGSYAPTYSYPGLSGFSGSTGLFGPAPGSMGTGRIASTTPGSMLGSQAGVYGYPAGVPGSPAGAMRSPTLGG